MDILIKNTLLADTLLADVHAKKDLAFLSTDFIIYHASEQLRLNKKLRKQFVEAPFEKLVKSSEYKQLVKDIRAKCRTSYAVFQIPSLVQRRKDLLETTKLSDTTAMDELLQTHLSTKERISIYPELLALIQNMLQKINCNLSGESVIDSVLDLACGLNPIAYYYFTKSIKTRFVCNEQSDLDCAQLNTFFQNNHLPANAHSFDLVRETTKLQLAPLDQKYDVCFLLKTLDTLESQRLYVTYDVLKNIRARLIVASFPIRSIRGKRMDRSEQIFWFEKMLGRLEFKFTRQVIGDEVFYFCNK